MATRLKAKFWPDNHFWSSYIKKVISFSISLKVLLILTATILLCQSYLTGGNWVTVVGIILGARLSNQLMFNYKNGYTPEEKTISRDLGV